MAHENPAPRLAYEDWKRARDAGIALPVPPAELRPWRPGTADVEYWREAPPFVPLGDNALVMAFDPEPHEAQAFYRAAETDGLAGRLFEADNRFEGYGWYGALHRVRNIRTEITAGDVTRAIGTSTAADGDGGDGIMATDFITGGGTAGAFTRPDAIRMRIDVTAPDGTSHIVTVPADLAFVGEAYGWLQDAVPLVTRNSGLTPEDLAALLHASFFSPSDDPSADAWETQSMRFEEEALHMALKLLASDDEARRRSIANAVRRELLWLMPPGREVGITVRDREVAVELGAPPVNRRNGRKQTARRDAAPSSMELEAGP